MVSPYLQRPLRTVEQARRDIEARRPAARPARRPEAAPPLGAAAGRFAPGAAQVLVRALMSRGRPLALPRPKRRPSDSPPADGRKAA